MKMVNHIHSLRLRTGMTQAQLANALGCRQSSVSRWEAQLQQPGVDVVFRMSRLFGCTVQEIVTMEEGGTA